MNYILQIIIILLILLFFVKIIRDVRKGRLRSEYAVGWLLSIALMLILSIFPDITFFFAGVFKFQSPINLVYAIILFLLIVIIYSLMLRISRLEETTKDLVQEFALLEKERENEKGHADK